MNNNTKQETIYYFSEAGEMSIKEFKDKIDEIYLQYPNAYIESGDYDCCDSVVVDIPLTEEEVKVKLKNESIRELDSLIWSINREIDTIENYITGSVPKPNERDVKILFRFDPKDYPEGIPRDAREAKIKEFSKVTANVIEFGYDNLYPYGACIFELFTTPESSTDYMERVERYQEGVNQRREKFIGDMQKLEKKREELMKQREELRNNKECL